MRTLQSERAWVASLDEMRLDDMAAIQTLESRLEQWAQLSSQLSQPAEGAVTRYARASRAY